MAAIPYDVAEAFTYRKRAARGAFRSDGTALWSYGMLIATWNNKANMICIEHNMADRRSQTTSRHLNAFETVMATLQSDRPAFWQDFSGYRRPR